MALVFGSMTYVTPFARSTRLSAAKNFVCRISLTWLQMSKLTSEWEDCNTLALLILPSASPMIKFLMSPPSIMKNRLARMNGLLLSRSNLASQSSLKFICLPSQKLPLIIFPNILVHLLRSKMALLGAMVVPIKTPHLSRKNQTAKSVLTAIRTDVTTTYVLIKGLVCTTSLPLVTFSQSNIIALKTNNTFLVYSVLSTKPDVTLL